jgi:hypothetical protein
MSIDRPMIYVRRSSFESVYLGVYSRNGFIVCVCEEDEIARQPILNYLGSIYIIYVDVRGPYTGQSLHMVL